MVDFEVAKQKRLHGKVHEGVRKILDGEQEIGGDADLAIEQCLRELWGLTPNDGAAVNTELASLPSGQAIRDLAPLPKRTTSGDRSLTSAS